MGNTHLEPATKKNLLEYMEENGYRTISRGIDGLLAEHKLLLATQQKCELLEKLFEPYELDEVECDG